jgi:hypothetical protein
MLLSKYCKRALTSISEHKVLSEVTVDPNYLSFKETKSTYYRTQTMAFGICPTLESKYLINDFSSDLKFLYLH